ncbi:phosphoribosyltransferase [Puniceibacterium sediminis]|uniref:Putative phosphoribosyl transferase n=1 Tax=Puniceibacterium sediminis TaxID=1608407 RepID=A0A238ZF86_9RHOB|nr:phosphoribosyltransferase [Puniceibacterium sediminis]SNR81354.1 putative phosphoribosyl transferase [Puniceibacterium sediminis]
MNTLHLFKDRREAGRQLAAALPPVQPEETVVVALPRGGVPVAEEICRALHVPLDLVFVRKIGAPGQPEVAVGAVTDGAFPQVTVNERVARAFGMTHADVEARAQALMPEIARRRQLYLQGIKLPDLKGKTLIVVDDGVATGATARAGLRALRESGASRIILALPVAAPDALRELAELADQTVCLNQPHAFMAVGAAYQNFSQTSDDDVVEALRRCNEWSPA